MKLKVYLEKQLQEALDHQDKHPVSGSANRAVKEARKALEEYNKLVDKHENSVYSYSPCESMHWFNRGD